MVCKRTIFLVRIEIHEIFVLALILVPHVDLIYFKMTGLESRSPEMLWATRQALEGGMPMLFGIKIQSQR